MEVGGLWKRRNRRGVVPVYALNKVVGFCCDPMNVAMLGVLVALFLWFFRCRRAAGVLFASIPLWIWIWATPVMSRVLGAALERPFLVDGHVLSAAAYPEADAIVLHGGAMAYDRSFKVLDPTSTNAPLVYTDMRISADRVWMAVQLWKAGKAPKIYATGTGCEVSTPLVLLDFGVPADAVIFAPDPRNTEEEARYISTAFASGTQRTSGERKSERKDTAYSPRLLEEELPPPRVLVVTSSWHMKRTMMMYQKYAPNVTAIPAATDFENTLSTVGPISWKDFLPLDETLVRNRVAFHELIGIIGYSNFR